MGQVAASTFGIGTPGVYPAPSSGWGINPYGNQGYFNQGAGTQQWGFQPYLQQLSSQSLPQLLQVLQILPQQLQQVQFLQQQQLIHLQQLLQVVPAQLQQIQQLLQVVVPQQVQQFQPFGSGISGPIGFGSVPQAFSGQVASHVM